MAGKGAPEGNQYAKKPAGKRRRGMGITLYVRADDLEMLRECVEFERGAGDDGAVRQRIGEIFDEAIKAEMRRVFAKYAATHGES